MANHEPEINKEIDFSHLSKRLKKYYTQAGDSFFNSILFLQRNIIVIAIIVIAGAGLGTYLDSAPKAYSHKVFVIPNFGSVDYLYEEVNHIDSKIKEHNISYLKSLGIERPEHLAALEIEPVVDVYNFVDDNDSEKANLKLRLFETIAEQGDVNKVMEDNVTARNYKTHLITVITRGPGQSERIIKPILKHFNANTYFREIQTKEIANNAIKLQANDKMISQIDSVISDFSRGSRNKSNGLMYYNDNTQLNELFRVKDQLLKEQAKNRINELDYTQIVKKISVVPNSIKTGFIGGKMKIIVPLFFLFVFVIIVRFIRFYKKQVVKRAAVL